MLPNRQQDAFVYNQKTNQIDPINLIATDRVKCLNCNKYFLNTEIQAHLEMHNNQQIIQRSITAPVVLSGDIKSSGRPLDLSRLATKNALRSSFHTQSTFDLVNQPFDVQTMTADQLPQPEYRRKQIEVPLPHTNIQPHQSQYQAPQPLLTQKIGNQPKNLYINTNVPIETMRQQILTDDYFEHIPMQQPRSIAVTSHGVSMKRNINAATFIDRDEYVDPAKVQYYEEQEYSPNTYVVTPYDQIIKGDKLSNDIEVNSQNSNTVNQPTLIEVPDNRRYLAVESHSKLNTKRKDNRSNTNLDAPPIPQHSIGGINLSRNTIRQPSRPQQNNRSRGNFFSLMCGDPESTLNNQLDIINHDLDISRIQSHDHLDGNNYACPSCGGFYCPTCKSTVPPQYRRPPPYTFNQDIHLQGDHTAHEIRTNVSYVTPFKNRQI